MHLFHNCWCFVRDLLGGAIFERLYEELSAALVSCLRTGKIEFRVNDSDVPDSGQHGCSIWK